MTSTEFAAKYRLLKNVATRGARSFLAQQVELGRMVMVHYLDAENGEERATTLARLQSLQPPARGKLLEIADVDGTPVAVTLFISSFQDFASWLDSVSPSVPVPQKAAPPAVSPGPAAAPAGEFTRMFSKIESPPTPIARDPVAKTSTPKPAGEFTSIFGKLDELSLSSAITPPVADAVPATAEDDTPTVIMEAVKPPHTSPSPSVGPLSEATPETGSSFTAIFGSLNHTPHVTPDAPPLPPVESSSPRAPGPVIPPPLPAMDLRPTAPSPVPPPASADQPGEFTQLFEKLASTAGGAPPAPPAALLAPDVQRPLDPTPRADVPAPPLGSVSPLGVPSLGLPPLSAPPLAAPSLGLSPDPLLPAGPPKPDMPARPNVAPPPPQIGGSIFGNSGPSEFTRMLTPITLPPPPPVAIQAPAAAAGDSAAGKKSMLPLLIGLGAVIVLTVAIVVYFVVRGARA
jgi:hypothetical protein